MKHALLLLLALSSTAFAGEYQGLIRCQAPNGARVEGVAGDSALGSPFLRVGTPPLYSNSYQITGANLDEATQQFRAVGAGQTDPDGEWFLLTINLKDSTGQLVRQNFQPLALTACTLDQPKLTPNEAASKRLRSAPRCSRHEGACSARDAARARRQHGSCETDDAYGMAGTIPVGVFCACCTD